MSTLILALVVAVAFSGWPFLLRYGGVSSVWSAVIINAVTTVVAVLYLFFNSSVTKDISSRALMFALAGGVINGIGFLVYTRLLSSSQSTSTVILLINITVPIVALLLGVFLHEKISLMKIVGVIFALIGIYLITK